MLIHLVYSYKNLETLQLFVIYLNKLKWSLNAVEMDKARSYISNNSSIFKYVLKFIYKWFLWYMSIKSIYPIIIKEKTR